MPRGSDLSSPFPLRALNHTVGVGCKGPEGNWEGQSLNKIISSGMLCIRKWYSAQPFRSKKPQRCRPLQPPPNWSPGRLPAGLPQGAGQGSGLGREWCLGWDCIVRWGGWTRQGSCGPDVPVGPCRFAQPVGAWEPTGPCGASRPRGAPPSHLPPTLSSLPPPRRCCRARGDQGREGMWRGHWDGDWLGRGP